MEATEAAAARAVSASAGGPPALTNPSYEIVALKQHYLQIMEAEMIATNSRFQRMQEQADQRMAALEGKWRLRRSLRGR